VALLYRGRSWAASKPRSAGAARDSGTGAGHLGRRRTAGAAQVGWAAQDIWSGVGLQGRPRLAEAARDDGDVLGGGTGEGRDLLMLLLLRHPPLAAACAGGLGTPPPPPGMVSGPWKIRGEGGWSHTVGGGWRVRTARKK
jgi:hypothetical protein